MSDKEFTLEELNYFRVCYITANTIRDGLQSVFKQEWDRVHGWRLGPWQDTGKNGQDFFNMESPKSQSKNKRFLSVIRKGKASEWDCACFFFAILFSDSLGPLVSPTVAINVDGLRVFRNGVFAHLSQASIPQTDFQANVKLVSSAFTALNLDTKELLEVSNLNSFPTGELQKLREQIDVLEKELQAKPTSFMCLPPGPSHEVTERKSEMQDVTEMFMNLQNTNEDGSIVTVYVSGNPGCGKSQIARAVGKKLYDEAAAANDQDSCTFVMTFNAESEQSMLDSYYKFARELGVTEYSLNSIIGSDSKLKPDEKLPHLITLVSTKIKAYSTWLIIFDNANDLTTLRNCWPSEKWGGCGKVLVTTQDSTSVPFADPSCRHISLSRGMQMVDALSLLKSICQFSCDNEEVEHSVVKALDFQPLAIACAALYVRYSHADGVASRIVPGSSTWRNYLKKLEMGKRHLTETIYERTSKSYPLSMTSAVEMAVHKLVENEVFKHVVHFLGLGAPAPIDIDITVNFVAKQEPTLDEDSTAADIAKCSLLIPLVPDDSPRTLIRAHQVVHDVFRNYILDKYSKEEVATLACKFTETLSPFAQHNLLQFDLEFHIYSKRMAPHLKSFSTHLEALSIWESCVTNDERSVIENSFLNFGDICRQHGLLSAARTYFEQVLGISKDADERTDDENQINFQATIMNNLGTVYRELGQLEKAQNIHERALVLLESKKPTNPSPELADSFIKLGNVFFGVGQFERAKEYFFKSLKMREVLYGSEHATVADALTNLGTVHSVMGDLKTAENFFLRSHTLRKKTFGKMHPRVADSLTNLGIVYSKLGQDEKAIQHQKEALEMREKLFFPDHTSISESYNNLGLAYKSVGQLEQTRNCYESALRIREQTLDKEHPAMAGMLSNLGVLYMDLGELQRAKDFHHRALQIRTKVLGSTHCKVGDCMLNLGLVHERCSEYEAAASHFQQAVDIYANVYPTSHVLCQSAALGLKRVSRQGQRFGQQETFDFDSETDSNPCSSTTPCSSAVLFDHPRAAVTYGKSKRRCVIS